MCREQQAREGNKTQLLTIADGHKNDLDQHNTDIDALTAELSKADQIAAEREREFITAKDAAAALGARLAEAKYALPIMLRSRVMSLPMPSSVRLLQWLVIWLVYIVPQAAHSA